VIGNTHIQIDDSIDDHSELVNLAWSVAGHTIDANIDFAGYDIDDVGDISLDSITSAGAVVIPIDAGLNITLGSASMIGMKIKGAVSQAVSYVELRDSSNSILMSFDKFGRFGFRTAFPTAPFDFRQAAHNAALRFVGYDTQSGVVVKTAIDAAGSWKMSGAPVIVSDDLSVYNITVGIGAAGVDYTLTFNGETNDGVLTWMEDEAHFKFDSPILLPYLGAAPATLTNGLIWMESDGLHIYYAGAEKLVAGV